MTDLVDQLATALGDRYHLESGPDGHPRVLGSGGMAVVYLARDLKHDRPVAVKVLRPELAAALGAERFLREVQIAAHLQHPHILSVLDSGEFPAAAGPSGLYYVMPFVEGESLRNRLAREGELPIGDAARILAEVVDALAFAHGHGIVHRDIKPENVLLSGRHALVADFGVAKAVTVASEASRPALTTVGIALGTPAYMAPEQATADPHADHRVDLYAAGLLGYEMLTGRLPFSGETPQALLAAQVTATPQPLTDLRPATPAPMAAAIMRCLEKHPADRWPTAGELLAALETQITPQGGTATEAAEGQGPPPPIRRSSLILAAAVGLTLLATAGWWLASAKRRAGLRWAREQAVHDVRRLADEGQPQPAFSLLQKAHRLVPDDTTVSALWLRMTVPMTIRSDPPGARVYLRPFALDTGAWDFMGVTPLDSARLPRGYHGVRLEKDGRSFEGAVLSFWVDEMNFTLDGAAGVPREMSKVGGGDFEINLPGLDHLQPIPLGPYLIARREVTNQEYKQFVDSGGYRRPELWEHSFERDGRRLGWDARMALFRDRTGRPGPATWEAGDYAAGTADHPVAGVSWFEAAAYARFVDRQLPTIYHWNRAAEVRASSVIIPASNFAGQGAKPVTEGRGLGPWGTVDMAGNVREWCLNATRNERYILGGGWNDQPYQFLDAYAQSPFDRSPTNGIRLVKYLEADSNLALASREIDLPTRDFSKEQPVPDAIFAVYRRLYDYDRGPVNARLEESDSSAPDWVREKVTFDAAYGNERVIAYLFLPRHGHPPYHTLIYFPGSNALHARESSGRLITSPFDFILKSGRAVLHPIYKSTYERGDGLTSDYADETVSYRDHVVMWAKDLRRSVDYLETRAEIDTARLAYYGLSWGGYLGGILPAVEPRLKASVLYVAGLEVQRALPEAEPINFLPRIRIPTLMLNGRYDHFFPIETSQKPMFQLLGTSPEHKRHVIADGGHFMPRPQWIRETLDWLDRYLGPVR